MANRPEPPAEDPRTPVEKRLARSFVDPESGYGKPLSRRTRQTQRSVEAYLKAGVIPRYMERLREIANETKRHQAQLKRSYERLREQCGEDAEEFERRWRARVDAWDFRRVNELI